MNLSYCHEKLSAAVSDLCVSALSPADRLRSSISHWFTLPLETFPEGLREQFSEIKSSLAGVRVPGHTDPYPDPIDRMMPTEVTKLIGKVISLREGIAKEYYGRAVQG
jgi:hypothetical protein